MQDNFVDGTEVGAVIKPEIQVTVHGPCLLVDGGGQIGYVIFRRTSWVATWNQRVRDQIVWFVGG